MYTPTSVAGMRGPGPAECRLQHMSTYSAGHSFTVLCLTWFNKSYHSFTPGAPRAARVPSLAEALRKTLRAPGRGWGGTGGSRVEAG